MVVSMNRGLQYSPQKGVNPSCLWGPPEDVSQFFGGFAIVSVCGRFGFEVAGLDPQPAQGVRFWGVGVGAFCGFRGSVLLGCTVDSEALITL